MGRVLDIFSQKNSIYYHNGVRRKQRAIYTYDFMLRFISAICDLLWPLKMHTIEQLVFNIVIDYRGHR
jgi:hypothetical protein